MTHSALLNGVSGISCCVSVGSLISAPATAAACTGAVVMNQSDDLEFAVMAGTATAHRFALARLRAITENAVVATSLQAQKESHTKLLEYSIRWEVLRAEWFSNTQQWSEVQRCLARQQNLELKLEQARIDAAIAAEERPARIRSDSRLRPERFVRSVPPP